MPEGYKTGNQYGGFTLFSDTQATSSSPMSQSGYKGGRARGYTGSARVGGGAERKELLPFSGILKIGGLSQQQQVLEEEGEAEKVEEVPWLSSQGSTISNVSVASVYGNNKRRFNDEEEDERDEVQVVEDVGGVLGLGGRAIVTPKRRKGLDMGKTVTLGQSVMPGQENEVDFGEAEFLDYGICGEVEMSDV